MNLKWLLVLITVFVLTALVIAPYAQPVSANHSWGNYHWARTGNPFTLQLGDNLTSKWKPILATTSSDWSKSTVLDTVIVAGRAKGNCRPTSGRVEVCNAAYGQNGWLGLAQIWISGGHISQGTAKMNDTYFNLPAYNTTAERNHVMCQEVGHTFGLGHQDESGAALGTCMDYSMDAGSQHPNQHDYDQLVFIYGGHTDASNSFVGTPANLTNADYDRPNQWGQQVRGQGRAAVYARDFGGGHFLFTFVVWAR